MIFKAGDLVWHHNKDGTKSPGEVIGGLPSGECVILLDGDPSGWVGNLEFPPHCWRCVPGKLTPRGKPPADREELGKWSECPWQPEGVRV